jgi:hypothetical protein
VQRSAGVFAQPVAQLVRRGPGRLVGHPQFPLQELGRDPALSRTVLVLFAFQTLVTIGSVVLARYRMNVEPFLYAYAAVGAVGLSGWLRRGLRISGPGYGQFLSLVS